MSLWNPQPGAHPFGNRSQTLSAAEVKSWCATEQKEPDHLLNSKFLSKREDFSALLAARRLMHSQQAQEPFCRHKDPCTAPQDGKETPSYEHMAALDAACNIWGMLASREQAQRADTPSGVTAVDLSLKDPGAVHYLLTQSSVAIKSARLVNETAAGKLQSQNSCHDCHIQSVYAAASEMHPKDAAAPGGSDSNVLEPASSMNSTRNVSAKGVPGSMHSLACFQTASMNLLAQADLVIGDLNPEYDLPNQMSKLLQGPHSGECDVEVADAHVPDPPSSQADRRLGVMEAEYGIGFRRRLLWECAMALSCLQPGRRLSWHD